jgi:hypothetical protein
VVLTPYPTLESGEQLKSSEKEKFYVRPIPSVKLPQGNIRLSVVSIAISEKRAESFNSIARIGRNGVKHNIIQRMAFAF